MAALMSWFNGISAQVGCYDFRLACSLQASPLHETGNGAAPRPPTDADWAWTLQQLQLSSEQVRGSRAGGMGAPAGGQGRPNEQDAGGGAPKPQQQAPLWRAASRARPAA
jgi:hypothetical protein